MQRMPERDRTDTAIIDEASPPGMGPTRDPQLPPPPLPRPVIPRFSIHWWAWPIFLAFLASEALIVWPRVRQEQGVESGVSYIAGHCVGGTLFFLALAWGIWRLAGRGPLVGSSVFAGMLAMGILSNIATHRPAPRASAPNATRPSAQTLFDAAALQVEPKWQAMEAAVAAVNAAGELRLGGVRSPEQIDPHVAVCNQAVTSLSELKVALDRAEADFRAALSANGYTQSQQDAALVQFTNHFGGPKSRAIRDASLEEMAASRDFFAFAREHWGKWSYLSDVKRFHVADAPLADRFDALRARVREAVQAKQAAQAGQ